MKSFSTVVFFVLMNIILVTANPQYTGCGPDGCYSTGSNGQVYGCGPNGCGPNGQQPKINVQATRGSFSFNPNCELTKLI